jgi:hypothetical protein
VSARFTVLYAVIGITVLFSGTDTRAGASVVDPGDFEAGIILGEPTGGSFKYWTRWNAGMDLGIAWSFSGSGHFTIFADYLFHNFDFFADREGGDLPVYVGLGVRYLIEDDAALGLRIPIGINYLIRNHPLSLFAEIVPLFDFIPETEAGLSGGVGIRYRF